MDIDIFKTSANDGSSMDMMVMMEKFPELCEPFYNTLNFDSNVTTPSLINPPPPSSGNFINNIPLQQHMTLPFQSNEKKNSMAAMREMIFRVAVMQPVQIDPESIKPPKRKNVKISKDPQSVAARHRRERISERIRILQRLVPGGTKMDTASMLDEAIHYMKFLKKQVQTLQQAGTSRNFQGVSNASVNYSAALMRGC